MTTFLEYLSDVSDEQFEVDLIGEVNTAGLPAPIHELNFVRVKPEVKDIARNHLDRMSIQSYSAQYIFDRMEGVSRILYNAMNFGDAAFNMTVKPARSYHADAASVISLDNDDLTVEELLDGILQSGGSYQLSIPPRRRTAVIPNVSLFVTNADGVKFTHIGPRNADWRLILLGLVREAGFLSR